MATFERITAPRKRIVTYGKSARRRLPEYNLASLDLRTHTSEFTKHEVPVAPLQSGYQSPIAIEQSLPSNKTTTGASVRANIFDVSSSEDEVAPSILRPLPKFVEKMIPEHKKRLPNNAGTEVLQEQKRRKFSPLRQIPKPSVVSKTASKKPSSRSTSQVPPPQQQRPQPLVGSKIASRPKLNTKIKSTKEVESPLQGPGTPQRAKSENKIKNGSISKHISPKGLQIWKGILESSEESDGDDAMVGGVAKFSKPSKLAQGRSPAPRVLFKPAGVSKSTKSPHKPSRRRLIDTLVEQAPEDEDSSDMDEVGVEVEVETTQDQDMDDVQDPILMDSMFTRPQSRSPETLNPSMSAPASQSSQNVGPKFTYSRQRSMLAEGDFMDQLAFDMPSRPIADPSGRRGSIPRLKPLASFHEENEVDEAAAGSSIRTVHELRQAGANSRFLDEVEDLIDRIGSPVTPQSSMRRSALLDLGSKLKDKTFARQFRAAGTEQRLFVHLGKETDVIAGSIIVSLVLALCVDGSMPHIVAQLRRQGITRLLPRLLSSENSILLLAKDRKNNMSKVSQSLLADHHKFLLQLPAWEELQPEVLSPRTIALKCLELMVRQTRESGDFGDIISEELTSNLFHILKSVEDEEAWNLPKGREAIDLYLTLSTLESHSLLARTAINKSVWLNDYLPIIATSLNVALQQPIDDFGQLQTLTLRLTLNVTNKNPKACDVFATESLMRTTGQVIVSKFQKMAHLSTEEEIHIAVDHLILLLGAMINFAAWSSSARLSLQSLSSEANDPLNGMIMLFVDNREKTFEVRSSISRCTF